MRKHVLAKFPQQRFTSIQASTRRSVNSWLLVGSYMAFYLREKETEMSTPSAQGQGWSPGRDNAYGQVSCRSSNLGFLVQLKPHQAPTPAAGPSLWGRAWLFGGVFSPPFLTVPGKSLAESNAKRASRGGGGSGRTKGPGNLASFLIYLVPGLVKCLCSSIIQVQWLCLPLTITTLSCWVYWLELFTGF